MTVDLSKSQAFPTPRSRALTAAAILRWALVLVLLALGAGLRLYDLTDQPIDFHPTRQLRNAINSRGLYYQMLPNADPDLRQQALAFANSIGQYEPPFLETLVARAYLVMGGENLWVSRIFTSLFWIIGGIALFDLARRMAGFWAALAALAYYLVLPFAVQASRSFQPDPLMVMGIVLCIYFLYHWSEAPSWKWALLAGALGGAAILTKVVAAYILGPAAAVMVVYSLGWRRFWRSPQVWVMAALMIAPALLYYMNRQGRASDYFESWTLALSHLILEPQFYVRWLNFVQSLVGMTALMLSLVGALVARPRSRALLVGLWAGYAIYGLFLPYQMYTHSYYHLQLVPILALSLAPVAEVIFERVAKQGRLWQALFAGIALVALAFPAWESIYTQNREDYRNEPAYWQQIAGYLPTDGKILALTQDYGYRLMYYGWRKVVLWPNRGEISLAVLRGKNREFEDFFARRTEGKDYFLITAFGQYNDQPELKKTLAEGYPVYAQGDGYLIYDLSHPLSAP